MLRSPFRWSSAIPQRSSDVRDTPQPADTQGHAAGTDAVGTAVWERMAARLDAFASAWENPDDPPEIDDFLPKGHDGTVRHAALLELIKLDMEQQWNLGTPKWVEDYLEEYDELSGSENVPLDLIVQELHIRQSQGRNFEPQEYLERFPAAAERIRPLIETRHGCATASLYCSGLRHVREAIAQYRPGDRLEDFDLVQQLGAGSFATVFLAWQRSMQRWVALKLSAADGDEPQTLAQLQHSFIVRVYDVRDIEAGRLRLLYMEYVAGGSLQDILNRLQQLPKCDWSGERMLRLLDETLQMRHESPPQDSLNRNLLARARWPEAVCIVGSHVALAVSSAHRQGVLHRDIKPANVLVSGAGFPKLADFNVSFGSEVQGTTAAAHFGGSMAYMSPEQLDAMHPGRPIEPDELDGTSDTYALGILLWEMLTGERPFPSAPADLGWVEIVETLADVRQMGVPPERKKRFPADAPPALQPILLRCLEPSPARRFSDARELARQLFLCLHEDVQRLLWRTPTGWLRAARQLPLAILLICVLLPNLFFSGLNITYNFYAAEGWAPPDLFDRQVAVVNAVAYSSGLGLFLLLGAPIMRSLNAARKGEPSPLPPEAAVARTLRLGAYAALITIVIWTCCGVVFPVWTHVVVGEAQLSRYGHFFLSQVICGVLAGLIEYFLITFFAMRAWIPALLSPTETSTAAVAALRGVPVRVRRWSVVYALMPSLCLLLLSVGEVTLRFPFLVLGLVGAGGFVGILWLIREIQRDAWALCVALSPEPADALDVERPGIFETAKSVWSSVRAS